MNDRQFEVSSFRPVPKTGVIYVTTEATARGFGRDGELWCNLGQGMPDTGPLPGAPERRETVTIHVDDQEYAPVPGILEAREAVAKLYNDLYRKDKASKYTAENVAICGGGRIGLTRVVAALGQINLGHFLPDYTAYEELLDIFRSFNPIPIILEPSKGYRIPTDTLKSEILGRGLGGLLVSNPCNPTGMVIHGEDLNTWVKTARDLNCAMIFDEFYSNYIWLNEDKPAMVSAAEYVEDVDKDPVVLLNGLTKNWRYPGWRLGWVVGPKNVVSAVSSAGSFLDGGGSRPLQRAALPLLEAGYVEQETKAIWDVFKTKRQLMLNGLTKLGVRVDAAPSGTFYIWGDLSDLPAPINEGMGFFKSALDYKVIAVPGEFFDINPGKRRPGRHSRFRSYARFSFGASLEQLEEGLRRIGEMIEKHRGQ
ncbi:MAG: pyridoxal phosphate-dependent aminotransferase [Myxococcota bacterium]|nr:pyridoxal phosphate-dependent aminotransferase [Myxococcota bacterium]